MRDPLEGQTLAARFEIESLIGVGTAGAVYRAHDHSLDQVVALKVLRAEVAQNPLFVARFEHDAEAVSRSPGPDIVRILDFGNDGSTHYIVSEYVEAMNLFDTMQPDWPIPDERIVDVFAQTLGAVARAHEIGVVHGNLKHENILLREGVDDQGRTRERVAVCDFALAGPVELQGAAGGGRETQPANATLFGTPEFMSPEQWRGEPLDLRSDIYSLGVVLYHLVAGRLPFLGESADELLVEHTTATPIAPKDVYAGASEALQAVCLRALGKQRSDRYASAAEMRTALQRAIMPRRVSVRAPPRPASSPPPAYAPAPPPAHPSSPPVAYAPALPPASAPAPYAPSLPTQLSVPSGPPGTPAGTYVLRVPSVPPASAPDDLTWGRSPSRRVWIWPLATAFLGMTLVLFSFMRGGWRATPITPIPVAVKLPTPPPVEVTPNVPSPPTPPVAAPEQQASAAKTSASSPSSSWPRGRWRARRASAPRSAASPAASPEPDEDLVFPTPPPTDTAAPPAPAPSPAPAPPPPPEFEPSNGRVYWHVSETGGGATAGSVAHAISRIAGSWNSCYQSGLRARHERLEDAGTMRLSCDEQGRVTGATFAGIGMADVASCIRETAMGVIIPNADTGQAWATISLTFSVRE